MGLIVLRRAHRPAAYFAPESERLIVSPAGAEMAGVIVTVREQDYARMDARSVSSIFDDVMVSEAEAAALCDACRAA